MGKGDSLKWRKTAARPGPRESPGPAQALPRACQGWGGPGRASEACCAGRDW